MFGCVKLAYQMCKIRIQYNITAKQNCVRSLNVKSVLSELGNLDLVIFFRFTLLLYFSITTAQREPCCDLRHGNDHTSPLPPTSSVQLPPALPFSRQQSHPWQLLSLCITCSPPWKARHSPLGLTCFLPYCVIFMQRQCLSALVFKNAESNGLCWWC